MGLWSLVMAFNCIVPVDIARREYESGLTRFASPASDSMDNFALMGSTNKSRMDRMESVATRKALLL